MTLWTKALVAAFIGAVLLLVGEVIERTTPTEATCGFICIGPPSITHVLLPLGYYLAVGGTLTALVVLLRSDATPARLAVSLLPGIAAVLLVWLYWPPFTAARYWDENDFPQRPVPFLEVEQDTGRVDVAAALGLESGVDEPRPAELLESDAATAAAVVRDQLGLELEVWNYSGIAAYMRPVDSGRTPALELVVTVDEASARDLAEGRTAYGSAISCDFEDSPVRRDGRLLLRAVKAPGCEAWPNQAELTRLLAELSRRLASTRPRAVAESR
jgi:hypothetical protein